MPTNSFAQLPPPESAPPGAPQPMFKFSTRWLSSEVVRISATGDIDASNAGQLAEYVFHRGANCRQLILDLQDVEFFATAGFSALRAIGSRCTRAGVKWTLVFGRPVSRVLDICDPHRCLLDATA